MEKDETITCPMCGKPIRETAPRCLYCGEPPPVDPRAEARKYKPLDVGLLLIGIPAILIGVPVLLAVAFVFYILFRTLTHQ